MCSGSPAILCWQARLFEPDSCNSSKAVRRASEAVPEPSRQFEFLKDSSGFLRFKTSGDMTDEASGFSNKH